MTMMVLALKLGHLSITFRHLRHVHLWHTFSFRPVFGHYCRAYLGGYYINFLINFMSRFLIVNLIPFCLNNARLWANHTFVSPVAHSSNDFPMSQSYVSRALPIVSCHDKSTRDANARDKASVQQHLQKRSPLLLDYSNGLPERDFKKWMKFFKKGQSLTDPLEEKRLYSLYSDKHSHYSARYQAMHDDTPDWAKAILQDHEHKVADEGLDADKRSRQPAKAKAWRNYIEKKRWKYASMQEQEASSSGYS